ncbi:MAG TPA: TRAP transporter small permease subunit [Alphaproteobacteria bacterium]
MDRAASRGRRVLRLAQRAADIIAGALFLCVFAIFLFKVFMRYALHDAVAWADELSVVLFVWVIFWTSAFVIADRQQIAFDLVVKLLPVRARRWAMVARLAIVGVLFACALPGVVDYILFLWRERTPVLFLRLDVVYTCFALFAAAVCGRALIGLVKLLGPRWREDL